MGKLLILGSFKGKVMLTIIALVLSIISIILWIAALSFGFYLRLKIKETIRKRLADIRKERQNKWLF